MKNNKTIAELKRIAKENGGLLKPEIVVREARPRSSPLHSRFTWNDTKAAQEYRLWQARQLIRVVVEVIDGIKGSHEVFVSLTSDRKASGYRVMTDVLSNAQMRAMMLQDALDELEMFRDKYRRLKELATVFAAIRKVRKR
jgi:hypothetical protein